MSVESRVRPGFVVTYPNREKRASQMMRVAVVCVLVLSAVLILVVTVGGWSKLEGMIGVNLAWALVYLVIAVYVGRWARGLLPIAAALAALLMTFAIIAAAALTGINWVDRANPGYAPTQTLFGGVGLSPHALHWLVLAIAVVQALLVVLAMRAFTQGWNIEYEVPAPGVS